MISIWVVLAIFTTISLLTFNKYEVSEFGDYSLFIIDNRSLAPTFNKYDIVIIRKDLQENYNIGDQVFFYYGNKKTNSYINLGEITDVQRNEFAEDSYTFSNVEVSYDKIVGAANGAIVFNKIGILLKFMESQWGFMFTVILPTIYAVVYEIYYIVTQVKKETKKELAKEEE